MAQYRMTKARKEALLQLRDIQNRANKKVSRLKSKGVMIKGTEFDQRVNARKLADMSTVEIKRASRQLKTFVSRETRFVAGSHGAPIERKVYEDYQAAVHKRNKIVKETIFKWDDVHYMGPNSETIGERRQHMAHGRNVLKDKTSNVPYLGEPLEAKQLYSNKRTKKLAASLHHKSTKAYQRKLLTANRVSVDKMLVILGEYELLEKVNTMTADQFNFMFHNLNGINHIGIPYDLNQEAEKGNKHAQNAIARGRSQFYSIFERDVDRAIREV